MQYLCFNRTRAINWREKPSRCYSRGRKMTNCPSIKGLGEDQVLRDSFSSRVMVRWSGWVARDDDDWEGPGWQWFDCGHKAVGTNVTNSMRTSPQLRFEALHSPGASVVTRVDAPLATRANPNTRATTRQVSFAFNCRVRNASSTISVPQGIPKKHLSLKSYAK